MRFDETRKVIIDTLDRNEASAFIKFLESEIARHEEDTKDAYDLIRKLAKRFDIEVWND